MKKILSSVLFLFTMIFMVGAQNATLSVTGHVTDDVTGAPITNHLVVVSVIGAGVNLNYDFYTNDAGFYGSDSIPAGSQGLVSAVTLDCIGQVHSQEGYFYPDNYVFVFDFEICNDSIPPVGCQASFLYEPVPGAYATIMFFDSSTGNPTDWLWDFGDGTSSSEQNPIHSYNALGTYQVCLTIWDSTGNCQDTYCEDVVVGNGGGDCMNWFTYETNDNITFDFYGESMPYPANEWTWDFGDGDIGYGQNITHTYDTALYNIV
ncbi:MAG: PKD domain-containing protein, partial [Bacteroidales bacterium]|nr:PKD domain-containing protein [Bacteroidales bacterium]